MVMMVMVVEEGRAWGRRRRSVRGERERKRKKEEEGPGE